MFNASKNASSPYDSKVYLAFAYIFLLIAWQEGVLITECKSLPSENTTFTTTVVRNENKTTQLYKHKNEPAIEADLIFKITNKKWLDFMLRQTKHANKTESKQSKKLSNENIINRLIGKTAKENRFSDEINSLEVFRENNEKKIAPLDYSMEYIDLNSKLISISSSNTNNNSSLLGETNNQIEVNSIAFQTVPKSTENLQTPTTTMLNELVNLNVTLTTISIPYQDNPQFMQCVNACGSDHECIRQRCLLDSTYFG